MNEADATAKVIELCKDKYSKVIVSKQEKADANSKTLMYNNLLDSIHKVWRLKHGSKSNNDEDDNKTMLATADFKGKCYGCEKTDTRKTVALKKEQQQQQQVKQKLQSD